MTAYRNDLSSAHARIAELERRLAEKEGVKPAEDEDPPTLRAPRVETKKDDWTAEAKLSFTPIWHAWPIPVLAIAVVTYLARFGTTLPSWNVDELVPLQRGSLLCAAVSAIVMAIAFVLRVRNDGDSSVGQRLLMILAAIVSAPLLIVGVLALFQIGSIILGIVGVGAAIIGAIAWLVSFVRDGA